MTLLDQLQRRIWLVVQQIPAGMVSSYGDIAMIVGAGCSARAVGEALGALPRGLQDQVPWQRVINRDGVISTGSLVQRQLLQAEGVPFNEQGQVIMARCRWPGPSAEWAAANGMQTLPSRIEGEQLSLF